MAAPPTYITTAQFATMVLTPEETIRYWRHIGHGPKGFKLGRRVLYDEAEVRAWIEQVRAEQAGVQSA